MQSVAEGCRAVLLTAAPRDKVKAARALVRRWRRGDLRRAFDVARPARPARPDRPELLPPSQMPKRGRAGSERGRIAMLHALAHIEFGAIDLAIDMAGRFGMGFPAGFVGDWLGVAADEAMHFTLLDRRLRALGAGYGACRPMMGSGRRLRPPPTIPWPGWRSCRWCSKPAAST